MERWLITLYYKWKFRKHNDDTCCCGGVVGDCMERQCRYAYEYAVTSSVEDVFNTDTYN